MSFTPDIDHPYSINDILVATLGNHQAMWYFSGGSPDDVHLLVCEKGDRSIYDYAHNTISDVISRESKRSDIISDKPKFGKIKFHSRVKVQSYDENLKDFMNDDERLKRHIDETLNSDQVDKLVKMKKIKKMNEAKLQDLHAKHSFIEIDLGDTYQFYIYGWDNTSEFYQLIENIDGIEYSNCVDSLPSFTFRSNEHADLKYNSTFKPELGVIYTLAEIGKILNDQDKSRPVQVDNCEQRIKFKLFVHIDHEKALHEIGYPMSSGGTSGLFHICDDHILGIFGMCDCGEKCELSYGMNYSDMCYGAVYYTYGLNTYLEDKFKLYKSLINDVSFIEKCNREYKLFLSIPEEKQRHHLYKPQLSDINFPMETENFYNLSNLTLKFETNSFYTYEELLDSDDSDDSDDTN